ncbi:MAG: hypothetical protein LBI92_06825 [Azoarcus sp.]|jgi:hypothetical protein|nr:hypothetical protein [Azoarcus sp.]
MLLQSGHYIVERLKARCPEAAGRVLTTADLAGVAEAAQIAPALHVVLLDYMPAETTPGGSVRWDETWCVVALVRHAARQDRAAAQAASACPLLNAAVRALAGYRYRIVGDAWGKLAIVPGPRPYLDEAFAYFPFAVRAACVTQGTGGDLVKGARHGA